MGRQTAGRDVAVRARQAAGHDRQNVTDRRELSYRSTSRPGGAIPSSCPCKVRFAPGYCGRLAQRRDPQEATNPDAVVAITSRRSSSSLGLGKWDRVWSLAFDRPHEEVDLTPIRASCSDRFGELSDAGRDVRGFVGPSGSNRRCNGAVRRGQIQLTFPAGGSATAERYPRRYLTEYETIRGSEQLHIPSCGRPGPGSMLTQT